MSQQPIHEWRSRPGRVALVAAILSSCGVLGLGYAVTHLFGGDPLVDGWVLVLVVLATAGATALLVCLAVRHGTASLLRSADGSDVFECLRREQELLARTLETSRAGVVRVDRQGTIVFATPRAEALLQLQPSRGGDMPYEKSPWVVLDHEGNTVPRDRLVSVSVLASGRPVYGVQRQYQWPDGRQAQLTVSASPLLGAEGQIEGAVATVEDISGRLQAEGDLRESQRALSTLVSNLPGMVYRGWNDEHWTLEYVSEGCYPLTGYRPSDLQFNRAVHYRDLIHPEDRVRVSEVVQDAFDRSDSFEVTYRLTAAEGRERWVHDKGRVVRHDECGKEVVEGLIIDITERMQAEHRLRLTQFAVDRASVGISWVTSQGRYVYVNDASCAMLGYSRRELLSLHVWDVDTNVDPSQWPALWEDLRDRGTTTVSTIARSKAGAGVPEELTVNYFAYGSEEYALAFAVDISERKKAEAALRDRDEMVQLLIDSANDGINLAEYFPDSFTRRLLQSNDRYVEMSGRSRAELYATEDLNTLVEYTASREERNEWARKIVAGVPFRGTGRWIRPDGQENHFEWTATSLQRDGRTLILGVDRDITERMKADEALRRRLESERLIAEISARFVAVAPESIDSAINHALQSLGVFAGAGRSFVFLRDVGTPGTVSNTHEWAAEGVEPQIARLREMPEEGPYWWSSQFDRGESICVPSVADMTVDREIEKERLLAQGITSLVCVPIRVQGRTTGFVGFDFVTEGQLWHDDDLAMLQAFAGMLAGALQRERVERDREQLKQRLLQSQKLEAIGTLAGGVAHDFNNVLTGIVGYAGLLKMDASPGSEVHEAANAIEGAAQRGSQLTAQLLTFARKQHPTRQPLDLHALICDVTRLLKRTLGEDITVRATLKAEPSVVFGDPTALQQVVLNLAVNARDAMPTGGDLDIRTRTVDVADGDPLLHVGLTPNAYCLLSVRDNGTGIAADIRDRVFEPFFTTKEPGKGTGMGLAMVYGAVRDHGGGIQFESKVGRGTEFRIYLPLADESSEVSFEGEAEEPVHGSGHVLVVDDEPMVLHSVATMLDGLGYRVARASNGAEAVDYLRSTDGDVDLALVDLLMPGMGGVECIQALRTIRPGLPIILSTGNGLDDETERRLGRETFSLIDKPYGLQRLSEAVATALGASQ